MLGNDHLLKTYARRISNLHHQLGLRLTENETSMDGEHFPCGTFSYHHGFVNEKLVRRGPSYKKSRCPWDGVYLRTSVPAVNRQPGFRRELVEQPPHSQFLLNFSLLGTSSNVHSFFHENSNFSSFFQHFVERDPESKTRVWSSTKPKTHRKSNFSMI